MQHGKIATHQHAPVNQALLKRNLIEWINFKHKSLAPDSEVD